MQKREKMADTAEPLKVKLKPSRILVEANASDNLE